MASFCVKLLDTEAVMARKYLPMSLNHRCPAISVLSYWVALCTIDQLSTMRLARVGGRGSEKIETSDAPARKRSSRKALNDCALIPVVVTTSLQVAPGLAASPCDSVQGMGHKMRTKSFCKVRGRPN